VTLYDQLQHALNAEGINGSIVHVFLSLRMHKDTAHLDFQQAPSEREAREWMETEGRRFREPVAVGRIERDDSPIQLPPRPSTSHRNQSLGSVTKRTSGAVTAGTREA
jgi:hypothetical protein